MDLSKLRLGVVGVGCAMVVGMGASPAWGQCVPAPSGLVSWWTGDVDARDHQRRNDGVLVGDAEAGAPGLVAGAFSFDDAGYVSVPPLTFGPAFTLVAWINHTFLLTDTILGVCVDPNSSCTNQDYKFISVRVHQNGSILAHFSPTEALKRLTSGTTGRGVISEKQWFHVAATIDSAVNETRIYVDGVEQSVTPDNNGAGAGSFTAVPFIGASHDVFTGSAVGFWVGAIDELSFFDRVLSPTEIFNIFNAGSAGMCKCPWDCQQTPSGSVDVPDLIALLGGWGSPGVCDLDGSGAIAVPDLLQLLANWGPCP